MVIFMRRVSCLLVCGAFSELQTGPMANDLKAATAQTLDLVVFYCKVEWVGTARFEAAMFNFSGTSLMSVYRIGDGLARRYWLLT